VPIGAKRHFSLECVQVGIQVWTCLLSNSTSLNLDTVVDRSAAWNPLTITAQLLTVEYCSDQLFGIFQRCTAPNSPD
jgi:hypothetical protein